MKKTLAALIVSAFAASAANAAVVYDNEGTKVELGGSLRLIMEKADKKEYDRANHSTKKANSALRNAGSRFGVKVKHNLDNDFYALGNLELRFDDTASRDKFGGAYAKRAYVGLGSQSVGEIKFGRQLTIADDLSQANDYEYGFIPKGDYIPTSGTGVVRYDYKGIEGLQLSANYNFGQRHNEKGQDLQKLSDPKPYIKNAFALGALYTAGDLDARFAYGHTNFETNATYKHRVDGFLASLGYKFGDFTLTGDFGYAHEKENDAKTNKFYVSPGFAYQVTPMSQVYGNYLYERVKGESDVTTKEYVNDSYDGKVKDRAIGVGMRVFF